jgi:hypothetical protein
MNKTAALKKQPLRDETYLYQRIIAGFLADW